MVVLCWGGGKDIRDDRSKKEACTCMHNGVHFPAEWGKEGFIYFQKYVFFPCLYDKYCPNMILNDACFIRNYGEVNTHVCQFPSI